MEPMDITSEVYTALMKTQYSSSEQIGHKTKKHRVDTSGTEKHILLLQDANNESETLMLPTVEEETMTSSPEELLEAGKSENNKNLQINFSPNNPYLEKNYGHDKLNAENNNEQDVSMDHDRTTNTHEHENDPMTQQNVDRLEIQSNKTIQKDNPRLTYSSVLKNKKDTKRQIDRRQNSEWELMVKTRIVQKIKAKRMQQLDPVK
ncbi:14528_t:CDS:1 [Gigaspora margarita]|uniref:14528_t:CDS:1 n=1 Tax=Gigaspora margarita TaxID=4874 RepID=A0ABN7ULY0_GIGMA|nr:14528_t:CDS:1 [Gigaspora margarita]